MKPCGGRRISRILEADCALCRIPIYSISAPGLGTDMVLSLTISLFGYQCCCQEGASYDDVLSANESAPSFPALGIHIRHAQHGDAFLQLGCIIRHIRLPSSSLPQLFPSHPFDPQPISETPSRRIFLARSFLHNAGYLRDGNSRGFSRPRWRRQHQLR